MAGRDTYIFWGKFILVAFVIHCLVNGQHKRRLEIYSNFGLAMLAFMKEILVLTIFVVTIYMLELNQFNKYEIGKPYTLIESVRIYTRCN